MSLFKLDIWRRTIQITANVLVLAALCLSMYLGSRNTDNMLSEVSSWFFPMLGGILLCAWLASRLVRKYFAAAVIEDAQHLSVVQLPKQGAKLVRWTVLSRPRDAAIQKLRQAQQADAATA